MSRGKIIRVGGGRGHAVRLRKLGPIPPTQEISEHKGGISMTVDGVYGVDYLVENYYWNRKHDARCVVFVKSTVDVDFPQNEGNQINWQVGDVFIVGPGWGSVVARIDQEGAIRGRWYTNNPNFLEWPGPAPLAALEIAPDVPVVGSTGTNGVAENAANANTGAFFRYGTLDPETLDDWHTFDVADDDRAVPVYSGAGPGLKANGGGIETAYESDGKRYLVVPDPKCPCLSFVCRDDAARFYTTPAKVYFTPVIHPQWTRASGNVDLHIAALDRVPCWYSLVPKGDPPVWQLFTAAIDLATLAADTEYTLSYRIGAAGGVKTRTIHYNPASPSLAEAHPLPIMFKTEAERQRYRDRTLDATDPTPERHLFRDNYAAFLSSSFFNGEGPPYGIPLNDGNRMRVTGGYPGAAGGQFLVEGYAAPSNERAQFWADALLDNVLVGLDPIGQELIHGYGGPCCALYHSGGYTTFGPAAQLAMDYTEHIASVRAGGVRPLIGAVVEYRIRDAMGGFMHRAALQQSSYVVDSTNAAGHDAGMWSTCWTLGARMCAMAMPEYDTPYFGTSGSPRGSQPPPRLNCPWSIDAFTVWEWTGSKLIVPSPWPGLTRKTGFFGIWDEATLAFGSRRGYADPDNLMGKVMYLLMHVDWNYAEIRYPHLEKFLVQMADGSGAVPLQRVVNNLDEGLARIIPGEKAVAAVNNAAAPDGWIEVVGDFRDVPAFQDGEPLLFAQRWGRVGNVLNAPAGGTAYVDVWGDFTAFGYVAGGVIRLRSNPGAGEFTIVGDLVSLGGGQGTRFYVAEEISGATIDGFVVMPQAALADFTIAAAPTFDPETKRTRFKLAETLAGASAPDASIVLPHPSSETWIPFPAVVNSKPPFTAAATVAGPPANVAAMLHRLYQTVDSVHGDVAANGAYAAWLWRHPYAIFFEDDWAALVDP